MNNLDKFYINGQWVTPGPDATRFSVTNPATEASEGEIAMAGKSDVDKAIQAARDAFDSFSQTTLDERLKMLESLLEAYKARLDDVADAISREMGAPRHSVSKNIQAPMGVWHMQTALEAAKHIQFERRMGHTVVRREPAGVCVLITPWNWPINQIACKLAPAIVAGCTMVLKPSEFAPLSAHVVAEAVDASSLPAGVFNMIYGDGAKVGPMLSSDPRVDMVSLTGSTRAGESVSREAAASFKRVSLELGGKSPNIILPGADLEAAVKNGVQVMMLNTGQSCNAPSRMLVPENQLQQAEEIAAKACAAIKAGDPQAEDTVIGPIANKRQYGRVQTYIKRGQEEGAKLVCGGADRPDGMAGGYYLKPTVFSNVNNQMAIAREEIFGPVLTIIPYKDVE
ncbi:MAG: aldehyde dehydrogenase family protein, partial [Sinobacteraceae bacterium]|nr:aldehyde dehydrogenase family protein [Nevskiaceae bacterium]